MRRTPEQNLDEAIKYHRSGQLDKAEKHYKFVLKVRAADITALHFLGVIRYQQGRFGAAKSLISKAYKQKSNDPMIALNLGNSCQALGEYDQAIDLFSQGLTVQPANPQLLVNRGNAYRGSNQTLLAIADYQAALKVQPNLFEAARNLGISLQEEARFSEAKPYLERCAKSAPHAPEARLALANFYRETGQLILAKQEYEAAIDLGSSQAAVDCDLAVTLRDIGDLSGAEHYFKSAISKDAGFGRAWHGFVRIRKLTDNEIIVKMESSRRKARVQDDKMHLDYALGKAYEDFDRFGEAFDSYVSANKLCRAGVQYDVTDDLKFFDSLSDAFNMDCAKLTNENLYSTKRPIFIVGMPRSGTSLVEQILSSHSQVYGAGELSSLASSILRVFPMSDGQDYTRSLSKARGHEFEKIADYYLDYLQNIGDQTTPNITDKMPMNFAHIGIIRFSIPNALIVHCRRSAEDTCWSIYKNYLPAIGHYYATDLEDLGKYYKGYDKLMKFWHQSFPGTITDVIYENLVTNPEVETRRLLKACGLTFEADCLKPHKNKRTVSTLSAAQIRKPIYQGSIGSWKHYEKQLESLRQALAG